MLSKLLFQKSTISKFSNQASRHFASGTQQKGNFELTYEIAPRYFMVKYDIDGRNSENILEESAYDEHRLMVKKSIEE